MSTARAGEGGRERPGAAAGFTLVELVVVLVLTGVIGGSVALLLLRQSRFYRINDDGVFAERSLRATVDLLVRELRTAAPGDLVAASGDSVTVRADVHRGVVCRVQGDDVTWYAYASPPANLSGRRGTAAVAPYDSAAVHDDGWDGFGSTATAVEREACVDGGSPADAAPSAYRTVAWTGTSLPVPERGARVRVVAPLTYRIAPSSFGSGLAVWREGQELSAPFASARFGYLLDDGSERTSLATGELEEVERVRIELVATGDEPARSAVERRLVFDVVLRNRP